MATTKIVFDSDASIDLSSDTAVASDLLLNKTAHNKTGSQITGTMANNGAVSETLTTQGDEYVIPAGYHNGSGVITAEIMDGTLSASAAASGTVIGTTSSSYPITITATAGVADPGYVEDTTTETATITRYVQTETKTATPTTSSQTISPSSNKLLSSVTVNAMPAGSLGAITATKGSVLGNTMTITPQMAAGTAGYNAMATTTGTAVTVSASELVSGSATYTSNGTYDVTNLSSATVNVSGGSEYYVCFCCQLCATTFHCPAVGMCYVSVETGEEITSETTASLVDIFSELNVSGLAAEDGSFDISISGNTVYVTVDCT